MQIDLSIIPNPRKRDNRAIYNFTDLLIILILATMSGAENASEIAVFARNKQDLLNKFLLKPNQTPSHDTISHILQVIDPVSFSKVLLQFRELIGEIGKKINQQPTIAVDGKMLRRSYKSNKDKYQPPLMVSAFATESSLVLGTNLAKGNNEAQGVDDLLAILDIKGCIITADAAHARKPLVEILTNKGADYCICAKKNQVKLSERINKLVEDTKPKSYYTQSDNGHGRKEHRAIKIYGVPDDDIIFAGWRGLKAVGVYETTRSENTSKETTKNMRYFILSSVWNAKDVHDIIRSHWRIETGLHWVLDVHFGEDYSRCRNKNAPQNLAILKRLALSIIKASNPKNSLKSQMRAAGWNDNLLLEILSFK